jgi:hypothetical protein
MAGEKAIYYVPCHRERMLIFCRDVLAGYDYGLACTFTCRQTRAFTGLEEHRHNPKISGLADARYGVFTP